MAEPRLLSPNQQAAVARDSRLAVVIEVVLAVAITVPPRFPSLAYLAKVAHVSARTLERRFRGAMGVSYRGFKQVLRVRLAGMQLEDPSTPEKTVARDVGYASPGSLVRAFVRVDHVTPRGRKSRSTRRKPRRNRG